MHDWDVAIAVAAAGAAVVRQCFGTTLQRLDKGAGDFATHADIEAEHAMLAVLRRERPADAILGEESGRSGAHSSARTWLLDPLCGTRNYAVRMRVAAVNVALWSGGRFSAAAVADPFNGEIFWTDGRAAFVRADGQDTPLAPTGNSQLVDLNFDPPFPNAPAFKAVTLAADAEFAARFRPRVVSTSIALTWVATGQRAAYITDGDVRESVHFAAGLAICEAAGCTVTDLRGRGGGAGPQGWWRRRMPRPTPLSCLWCGSTWSECVRGKASQPLALTATRRSYWIPGSWDLRMVYTDDILFHSP